MTVRAPPNRSTATLAGRRTADLRRRVGAEIRTLREDAGVGLRALAAEARIDASYLSQVERAVREPSLTTLGAIAKALGADLSVRLYPNTGPAVRDRIQGPILAALLGQLHERWRRSVEVPVHRPGRGVIDVVLHDPDGALLVAGEVESRVPRLEQQIRWSNLKSESLPSADLWGFAAAGGTPTVSRLLVLRSTRATRDLVGELADVVRVAYPAAAAAAYESLVGRAPWPGAALLWADVERGRATIRPTPPRGILVGR